MKTSAQKYLHPRATKASSLLVVIAFTALSACTNSGTSDFPANTSQLSGNNPQTKTVVGPTYQISAVTVAATSNVGGTGTTTSGTLSATVFFDASKSTGSVSDSCTLSTGGGTNTANCSCLFTWQENNSNTASATKVFRSVQTSVTNIQPNALVCNAPSVYSSEILDGTTIQLTIVPSAANTLQFNVPKFSFLKQPSGVVGAFTDASGNVFDNILRYSCYEQYKRGMTVSSYVDTSQTDPATGQPASFVMASRFCIANANGTGNTNTQGCLGLPPPQNTSQAYYYNLYIQGSQRGNINTENDRYKCPKVKEPLLTGGTGNPDYWPLDSSFSLSVTKTVDFNVGVQAFSNVSVGSEASSVPTSCNSSDNSQANPGSTTTLPTNTLVNKCLGFAMRPNQDGTCPYFKVSAGSNNATGNIRNTYRLRRYVALYPPIFDSNGKMVNEPQATDTIYVLDRPVNGAANSLQPYTMRGPKPCPFAFFDHSGVLGDPTDVNYPGGMPSYAATNFPGWTGVNVDGIQFPNKDISGQSCSAAIPLFNPKTSKWSIGTLNSSNPYPGMRQLFVRPIQAWAPHYIEDTDFQACAPLSSPLIDAPLHFSKDPTTGNVAWCSEAYPSQNPNVGDLDHRGNGGTGNYPGHVIPFTSHIVKNSTSPTCNFSPIDLTALGTAYPAAQVGTCAPPSVSVGVARHPAGLIVDSVATQGGACPNGSQLVNGQCYFCSQQTCDRTVTKDTTSSWTQFPLTARAPQVEAALASDSTFNCTLTYDGGGAKAGKTTPAQGCCGTAVQVWTGLSSITASQAVKNTSAHFEPLGTNQCLIPNY